MMTNTLSFQKRVALVGTLTSLILYSTFYSRLLSARFGDVALSTQLLKPPNTPFIEKNETENYETFLNKKQIILNDGTISTIMVQQTAEGSNSTNDDHSNSDDAITTKSNNNISSDSPLIQSQPNQDIVGAGEKSEVVNKKAKIKQHLQQQHCWRHCPHRINKIYFHHGSRGLGDRHTAIHNLAQIAGYLCAELELPPPAVSLNPYHNNNKEVSKLVQWQDFFNLTFIQDKSPVISLNPLLGKNFEDWHTIPVYDEDKYVDWLHIVQNSTDFVSAYRKLQEFSWSQEPNAKTGFIWEIHTSIYTSNLFDKWLLPNPSEDTMQKAPEYRKKMQPYLPSYHYFHQKSRKHGCRYTNDHQVDTDPTHMKILRERIKRQVRSHSLKNSIYGYFHIRRGDAINDCETSVGEIQDFLSCSLNGTETINKNITFVLGSDEGDNAYRESIIRLADNYTHVVILDGDKLTREVAFEAAKNGLIREEIVDNNFYIYELEKMFWNEYNFTSITLSRRKNICPKCVPLMKYHALEWNS